VKASTILRRETGYRTKEPQKKADKRGASEERKIKKKEKRAPTRGPPGTKSNKLKGEGEKITKKKKNGELAGTRLEGTYTMARQTG